MGIFHGETNSVTKFFSKRISAICVLSSFFNHILRGKNAWRQNKFSVCTSAANLKQSHLRRALIAVETVVIRWRVTLLGHVNVARQLWSAALPAQAQPKNGLLLIECATPDGKLYPWRRNTVTFIEANPAFCLSRQGYDKNRILVHKWIEQVNCKSQKWKMSSMTIMLNINPLSVHRRWSHECSHQEWSNIDNHSEANLKRSLELYHMWTLQTLHFLVDFESSWGILLPHRYIDIWQGESRKNTHHWPCVCTDLDHSLWILVKLLTNKDIPDY